MPPTKVQKASSGIPAARRPISTRAHKNVEEGVPLIGKRKADASPLKNDKVKRSALGNLTNAVLNYIDDSKKHGNQKMQTLKKSALSMNVQQQSNSLLNEKANAIGKLFAGPNVAAQPQRQTKIMTRAASRAAHPPSRHILNDENALLGAGAAKKPVLSVLKPKNKADHSLAVNNNTAKNEKRGSGGNGKATSRRISNEFDLNDNEDSHYMSALEDL